MAIDDLAARRRHRHVAGHIRVGERHVPVASEDLQVPQAERDDREQDEGEQPEQLDAPPKQWRERGAALERALDHARENGLSPPEVVVASCGRRSAAGRARSSALRVSA